jgi:Na+-transporting NADH:ubiquinone oxidoreductase subunit NqrC
MTQVILFSDEGEKRGLGAGIAGPNTRDRFQGGAESPL